MGAHSAAGKRGLGGVSPSDVVVAAGLDLLCVLALSTTHALPSGEGILASLASLVHAAESPYPLLAILLLPPLLVLRVGIMEVRGLDRHVALVVAVPLALFSFVGRCFQDGGNLGFVSAAMGPLLLLAAIVLVGEYVLWAVATSFLYGFLRWACGRSRCAGARGGRLANAREGRYLACVALALVAAWSPYLVACLPGSPSYDFFFQIHQALGYVTPTDQHPYLLTMLMGFVYRFGHLLGGDFGGILTLVLAQVAVMALVMAYMLLWLRRLGVRAATRRAVGAFFALNPLFPLYAQYVVKDTVSAALMALFVLQVVAYLSPLRDGSRFASPWAVALVAILCCLSRKNCALIVLPTWLVVGLVTRAGERRGALAAATLALVAYGLVQSVLLPLLGVRPTPRAEALSIPLQQVAATVGQYPDDVTPAEGAVLARLADGGAEGMAAAYTCYNVDPVKYTTHLQTAEDEHAFLEVWRSMGMRHPSSYVATILHDCYAYWTPLVQSAEVGDPILPPLMSPEAFDSSVGATGAEVLVNPQEGEELSSAFPEAMSVVGRLVDAARLMPLSRLISLPSTYVLLSLALLPWLVANDRRTWALLVPSLLLALSCCASPLNGSMRYALPYLYWVPLQLATCACWLCPAASGDGLPDAAAGLAQRTSSGTEGAR